MCRAPWNTAYTTILSNLSVNWIDPNKIQLILHTGNTWWNIYGSPDFITVSAPWNLNSATCLVSSTPMDPPISSPTSQSHQSHLHSSPLLTLLTSGSPGRLAHATIEERPEVLRARCQVRTPCRTGRWYADIHGDTECNGVAFGHKHVLKLEDVSWKLGPVGWRTLLAGGSWGLWVLWNSTDPKHWSAGQVVLIAWVSFCPNMPVFRRQAAETNGRKRSKKQVHIDSDRIVLGGN